MKRRHASSLKSQIFQRENLGKRTQKSKKIRRPETCVPQRDTTEGTVFKALLLRAVGAALRPCCFLIVLNSLSLHAEKGNVRPAFLPSTTILSRKQTILSKIQILLHGFLQRFFPNSQTAGQPSSHRFCISFECSAPGLPPESTLCVLRRFQESSATAAPRPFRKCRWRQGRRRAPS